MSSFFISIRRELTRIRRRPRYFILLTAGIVFSYVFFLTLMREGQPQDLPIGVVDHDGSYLSRRFCHELAATQGVNVVAVYGTHAEAREAMQRQEIYAFMEIPDKAYSDLLQFQRPRIAVYSNNAFLLAGSLSYRQLATMGKLASGAVHQEVLKAQGIAEETIAGIVEPIDFDIHLVGNPMADYQPYVLATTLPGIIALLALLLTIFEVAMEQKERTAQGWVEECGGSLLAAVAGKLLPYTLWFSLLGIVGNIVFFGFFHFPMETGFGYLALGLVLLVLAAQCMGLFLLAVIPNMHLAVCVGAIYGALSFSLSGFSYPVSNMPPALQACSNLEPLRHYYLTYVSTALMGGGWAQCWPHLCCLLAFVACGLVGLLLMERQRSRWMRQGCPPIALDEGTTDMAVAVLAHRRDAALHSSAAPNHSTDSSKA